MKFSRALRRSNGVRARVPQARLQEAERERYDDHAALGRVCVAQLQALALARPARCLPLYSHLLGVCGGSSGASWRMARRIAGSVAIAALPSFGARGL